MASSVQTPIPNRRREPAGGSRGGITGAQSARQQRPAARGPYTPTPAQGQNRNGHMTTPSRPAQAPATVPRMNGEGKGDRVMNLNTPGRQDHPPVAGLGRSRQVSGHMGMDTPGPQARASMPAYMGSGHGNGNMNINTPVRNSTSHNPYPARQHAVYPPQANERPINFRCAESPVPQRAPPPAPPQPVPRRQNPNPRPVGHTPPLATEKVVHPNAQSSTYRPPQHQQRDGVLERGGPAIASRQIPAQANESENITRISPPVPQGRPISRANQTHPIPQQTEPPVQRRYSPPAPEPRGHPPPAPPRVLSSAPAPPPAPAQPPSDELAFGAPATLSKIRQFSAPSRPRPPRQPTAPPPPLPQRSPESIQVPSSAAEPPPHISRSPSPRNRPLPPPPLLQKETSIPNSRSPSPTRNPTNRPPKRPSTNNCANQPPTKRKTQFQSARLAEQEQDEIHDVDDSDDNDVAGSNRQGAGVIKLSSTSGPKKKMLLCARPPTFKFPPKQPEEGVNGNESQNRGRPKTVIVEEEDYGDWDEDDEIMSLY